MTKPTTIKIPQKAFKNGVVILDFKEYRKLQEKAVSNYYLTGKKAERLDKLVKEGLKEYKEGKTKRIDSLTDIH